MPIIKFLLNVGWMSAILFGPAFILLASWYRKNFLKAVIIWRKPESILLSVAYFIISLLLIIVGMACFFNFIKEPTPQLAEKYKDIAFICITFLLSLTLFFLSMRMLLIQVIMREGIVLNHSFFKIPIPHHILKWDQICDYYTQTDYPNIIFHIIYKKQAMEFEKIAISAPSHLQVFLKETLDASLDGEQEMPFYRFGRRKGVNGN